MSDLAFHDFMRHAEDRRIMSAWSALVDAISRFSRGLVIVVGGLDIRRHNLITNWPKQRRLLEILDRTAASVELSVDGSLHDPRLTWCDFAATPSSLISPSVTYSSYSKATAMMPSESSTIINSVFGIAPAGDESPDNAVAVVSRLAHSGRIIEFLCAIRDNPALVKHCAPMSYDHPLGFEKIMLIDAQPRFLLRMHAWRPGGEVGVEHVHNHRFMMATTVLRGSYDLQVFQSCTLGTPMVEYRETTGPDGRSWCLDTVGIRHLRLLTSARVSRGGGYALAADALHRVTVPSGTLCITLFLAALASAGIAPQTRVFAPPGDDASAQTRMKPLSRDEYRRRLDKITEDLTDLSNGPPSTAGSRRGCTHPGRGSVRRLPQEPSVLPGLDLAA